MKTSTKILFFIFFALLIVFVAYLFLFRPASLQAVKPVLAPAVQAVFATGSVEPQVLITIAPKVTGRLTELLVDEGDLVKSGQILARLENTDLQYALREARVRASQLESEYQRVRKLSQSGVLAIDALERAQADFEAAVAVVDRIEAEADYFQLEAPSKGTIIQRDGELGELIAAQQVIYWQSAANGIRITAEVDEEDIVLIRPGQEVMIRADAFPRRTFMGSVTSITPRGDPVSRSYRVRISIEPAPELMVGMTVEANVIVRAVEEALLIPATAVENDTVVVIRDSKAFRQEITIGASTEAAVEALEGIKADDIVLRNSYDWPKDGESVQYLITDWKVNK
jgi:RND family efflux transporter MFP subunit